MARFTTLYSGSSGNCAFIEEDGAYLLVDMGRSCRQTVTALKMLDVPLGKLGGILVTHEHSDHVSGLRVFLKHHPTPVYGSAATLDFLLDNGVVPPETEVIALDGRCEDVAGFGVESFATSHDSVDCRGYRITTPHGKVAALATDLGYVSDEVMANLLLADVVSLESNYDLNLLMSGPYPYYLKTRIASKRGHLCNEECAETIVRLLQGGCKRFALCHISKENNMPEFVYDALRAALLRHDIIPEKDCVMQAAERYSTSPVIAF